MTENLTEETPETEINTQAGMDAETQIDSPTDTPVDETAQKLAEAQNALAYMAAELENVKRATARRLDEERERTSRRVFDSLLPVLDNFGLALKQANASDDIASLRIGLNFIGQQLESTLQNAGLDPIPSVGESFDPAKHEALEEIESDKPSGTVVEEVAKGYSYGGQTLRVARVRVAK